MSRFSSGKVTDICGIILNFSYTFLTQSKKAKFTRRQDCPNVYAYNGAIYVMRIDALKTKSIAEFDKVKKYEMSELHSIDLDTPLDWDLAEIVLNKYLT